MKMCRFQSSSWSERGGGGGGRECRLRVVHDCVNSGLQNRAAHGVFRFMHQISGRWGGGGGRDAVSRGNTLAGKVHAPWVSLVFKSTSECHKTVVSGVSSRCGRIWGVGRGRGRRASVKRQFKLVMCLMKESVAAKNVLIRMDARACQRLSCPSGCPVKQQRWQSCRAAKGPEERA